jgi:acyl dehydratase
VRGHRVYWVCWVELNELNKPHEPNKPDKGETTVVDFDRRALGVESAPISYEVEKGAIRKFAEAIGDEDPIYYDEAAAKAAGFKTVIAPPTFLCTFRAQELPDLKITFGRVRLNGGNEYEYYQPIYAGDTITVTAKYADVSERKGRTGNMVFVITELAFRNQRGELVAKGHNTGIMRE